MKKFLLAFLSFAASYSYAQTTLSVDANGSLNFPKLVAQTTDGQTFFTGHQIGSTYGYAGAIFSAITDNPNGFQNYFYHGITNNVLNFSVRADGQGYFAGKVGVGISAPTALLSVQGTGGTSLTGAPSLVDLSGSSDRTRLSIGNTSAGVNGTRSTAILLYGTNFSGNALENKWEFGTDYHMNGNNDFYFYSVSLSKPIVYLSPTGDVGIGTENPNAKLAVQGTVHATEVLVDQNVPTPDYVFDKEYDLTSLKDVKSYIDQNHHLPEIPSAEQVAKNGINLGEMNAKLLKKIEELTLYLFEKDTQVKQQQIQMDNQQQQINELKIQMKALKNSGEKK